MKDGLHPEYKKTVIKCVCGNEIETGSVVDNLDSEGRVERFKKRYGQK